MKNLDSKKTHACDNTSMIQICGESIALSRMLLFEAELKEKEL